MKIKLCEKEKIRIEREKNELKNKMLFEKR